MIINLTNLTLTIGTGMHVLITFRQDGVMRFCDLTWDVCGLIACMHKIDAIRCSLTSTYFAEFVFITAHHRVPGTGLGL